VIFQKMKVKIKPIPPLSRIVKEIEVDIPTDEVTVKGLVKQLKSKVENLPFDESGKVKAGYIVLINGVDVRVLYLEDKSLKGDLELVIIPVNHGG